MSERSVQADVVKKAILKYKVSKLRGTTGNSVQGVSESGSFSRCKSRSIEFQFCFDPLLECSCEFLQLASVALDRVKSHGLLISCEYDRDVNKFDYVPSPRHSTSTCISPLLAASALKRPPVHLSY